MSRLLVFIGGSVGSAAGWWLGARAGMMTAFILSVIGTAIGVYVGRKLAIRIAE